MISVLMCVHNGEKFIAQAISSVLNQSFIDFEFVIVNDFSNDHSREIIKKYLARDKRIVFINNNKQLGLTRSLNKGLSMCSRDWIARIDHDDFWEKDKLRLQIEFAQKNPNIGLIGTFFKYVDINDKTYLPPTKFHISINLNIRNIICEFNPFCHSSVMLKKTIFLDMNGYDNNFYYAQDYELWSRVLKVTNAYIVPNVLTYRRAIHNNISFKNIKMQRFYAIKVKLRLVNKATFSYKFLKMLFFDICIVLLPSFFVNYFRKN